MARMLGMGMLTAGIVTGWSGIAVGGNVLLALVGVAVGGCGLILAGMPVSLTVVFASVAVMGSVLAGS